MKKIAMIFFVAGILSAIILMAGVFFLFIHIFQETPGITEEARSAGSLLVVLKNPIVLITLITLAGYSIIIGSLAQYKQGIKNPIFLMRALECRGIKLPLLFLALIPLSIIKLANVVHRLSKNLMQDFVEYLA